MSPPLHAIEELRLAFYGAVSGVLPRLIAAALLLLGSWLVAASARWAMNRAARTEWVERLLIRSGVLSGLVEPSLAASRRFVADVIYWSILLGGAAFALALLSDPFASRLVAFVLVLLPNMLLGVGIVLGAWWLGRYWSRSTLIWMANEGIHYPWRWAALVRFSVLAGGIAIASEATGFATLLIRSSFLILLAGITYVTAQALLPLIQIYVESAFRREDAEQRGLGKEPLPR